jgi:HSP20 family protein
VTQLIRRDPVGWSNLAKTFNDLSEKMQRGFGFEPWADSGSDLSSAWAPVVDIYDKGEQLVVQAELPGVKKEDIDVRVEGNLLMLSGKRQREKEINEEGYYRSERYFGKFSRTFRLPANVVGDKIDAMFKDGILMITMPKIEEAKPKQIQVK